MKTFDQAKTPEELGYIGENRTDLTPSQLDACIEGTDDVWRGLIGRFRKGLTCAQIDKCMRHELL